MNIERGTEPFCARTRDVSALSTQLTLRSAGCVAIDCDPGRFVCARSDQAALCADRHRYLTRPRKLTVNSNNVEASSGVFAVAVRTASVAP